ncbi:MAG TPA: hypothetical protein VFT74_03215, partial [Isosphaeraceae bacterium]|nr:hypothetical protein [Isosphaeraceae bacterium]
WLTGIGESLGRYVRLVGAMTRESSAIWGLAKSFLGEGLTRLWEGVSSNFKWLFMDTIPKMFVNMVTGLANVAADLFSKVVTRLGQEIHNALAANLPKWMPGGGGEVIPANKMTQIAPNLGLLGNPLGGVQAAPGLAPFMRPMPDRQRERAPFWERLQNAAGQQDQGFREQVARDRIRDNLGRFFGGVGGGAPGGALGGRGLGLARLGAGLLPGVAGGLARAALSAPMGQPAGRPVQRLTPIQQAARGQVMGMREMMRRQAEMARFGFSPTAAMEQRQRQLQRQQARAPQPTVGETLIAKGIDKLTDVIQAAMGGANGAEVKGGMFDGRVPANP